MHIAEALAERIGSVKFAALPQEAVHWSKVAILDTVGVTLAGSTEPCARIVDRVTTGGSSAGQSLVFGTGRRTAPLDAALINGTAAHAMDFDDCSNTLGGHPSAPILPALFALAETRTVDGRAFIAAYIAGWETETRISRGVNFHHYEKGWHPTATLGVFGATAACCHLLGLAPEVTAKALGLAASFASGVKANFGTMTKPLHVGHCSRNGLLAALLTADGFTASPGALEHRQGFLHVFNGAGNFDADAILRDWGRPFDIMEPGVAIKQYPCCGSTHPAVDAMLLLVREHDLTPDQVARVDSWTHARRLAHTNRPDPQSELDAKFSVQYCLARALLDRRVSLEHFEGDSFREPAVRSLLARIHAAPHPEMVMASTEHFGAEVRVTLTDGGVVSRKVDRPLGRTVENPLPAELLEAKFLNCASRVLPLDAAERLLAVLRDLDRVGEMRDVMAAMVPAVSRVAGAMVNWPPPADDQVNASSGPARREVTSTLSAIMNAE